MRHRAAAGRAGDHRAVQAAAVGDELARRGAGLLRRVARGLGEQPAAAARQVGHGGRAAPHPDHVDHPGVEALEGDREVRQQGGHRLGGGGHVGVAEHRQRGRAGRGDQADGGLQGQREGALGAGQELGDVDAVLRQQVLERVAGHLAGEPAELGPDRGQIAVDQVAKVGD